MRVLYGGTQEEIVDPDHSVEGWVPTGDGAYVVNEPQGSPGWYPVNDSPKDKATFDIVVTVTGGPHGDGQWRAHLDTRPMPARRPGTGAS